MTTLFYLLVVIFFPLTNLVELEEDLMFIPPPNPPMELLKVWILAPPPPKSSNPPPPNNDMEVVCPAEIPILMNYFVMKSLFENFAFLTIIRMMKMMEHTSRSTYCSKRWPHSSKSAKTPESSERRKGPSTKWHERFINSLMSCGCCMCMGCMMWIVALVAVCPIGMVSVLIKSKIIE